MVPAEIWLTRKGAALYLTSLGCPMTHGYLAKLALPENKGKGPAYVKSGWRTVRYAKSELDRFAGEKIEHCG